MERVWRYVKENKVITMFNFVILLIFIAPYSITYNVIDHNVTEKLDWKPNYIFENLELFILFIPLLLVTIGFQIMKFNIWRKFLLILLVVQCCAYALNSLLLIGIPVQDYVPSWGQFLTITLGPLILVILRIEIIDFKKKKTANTFKKKIKQ